MAGKKDALSDLLTVIASGELCTQEAGDGPNVICETRVFSSRTANKGERLGFLRHDWCAETRHWRWFLTAAGKSHIHGATP